MGIEEAIVWAVLALFCVAFVVRIAVGAWKFVYSMAPWVVPLVILALYMIANDIPIYDTYETEVKDANHIESIEDPSRRSGD